MATEFFIDSDDRTFLQNVFDDMLATTGFGKNCKVIYPLTETVCPNCIINPKTGESTNRYKTGGPQPFSNNEVCPVCEGKGRIRGTDQTEIIVMTIQWNYRPWNLNNTDVRSPSGFARTRGAIADLPKILRAASVVLDSDNTAMANNFKLYGKPTVLGPLSNNRYFLATWEEVS